MFAGVLTVLEGELENEDDLIVLMNEYGRFGWEVPPSQPARPFTTTQTFNITAEKKGVIDFQTEFDWKTRHWQYINRTGDRRNDFVNFRDKQVDLVCAALHNFTQTTLARCLTLNSVDTVPEYINSTEQINWLGQSLSHFQYQSSKAYEDCLQDHVEAKNAYQKCVRDQLVDYDTFADWHVGDRQCVGGGGLCGPPPTGQRPVEIP
jgi:hypothetical protein